VVGVLLTPGLSARTLFATMGADRTLPPYSSTEDQSAMAAFIRYCTYMMEEAVGLIFRLEISLVKASTLVFNATLWPGFEALDRTGLESRFSVLLIVDVHNEC
jgi:hypothetical protein